MTQETTEKTPMTLEEREQALLAREQALVQREKQDRRPCSGGFPPAGCPRP